MICVLVKSSILIDVISGLMSIPISSEARGNSASDKTENVRKEDTEFPTDEPEVLGEEALDFLEMFG